MNKLNFTHRTLLPFLAVGGLLLVAGCQGKTPSGEAAIEASLVPGADVAGRVDYKSMRLSPVADSLRQASEARNSPRSEEKEKIAERLQEATGVTEEDLETVAFSGDFDNLDFTGESSPTQIRKADALAALLFTRPLSSEGLLAGVKIIVEERPGVVVSSSEVDGRPVVTVKPPEPEAPDFHAALSKDGRTVFLSFSVDSLKGAFRREEERRSEDLPPSLEKVMRELPGKRQMKTALVLPETLRRQIEESVSKAEQEASTKPMAGMILGFVMPFKRLGSLSLGVGFGDNLDLGLAADLGGEAEALQAATLIQTMAIPMIRARLEKQGGKALQDIGDKVAVASNGSVLRLDLKLAASDLSTLSP